MLKRTISTASLLDRVSQVCKIRTLVILAGGTEDRPLQGSIYQQSHYLLLPYLQDRASLHRDYFYQ